MPRWEYTVLTHQVKGWVQTIPHKQVSVRRPDGKTVVRFTSTYSSHQHEWTNIWFDAHGEEICREVSSTGDRGVYDEVDETVWLALINELGQDGWEALNERVHMAVFSGFGLSNKALPHQIELMFKRQLPVSGPQ